MPNRKAKDRKRKRLNLNARLNKEGRTAKQIAKYKAKNPDANKNKFGISYR
jgi:hypothetical protein